MKPCWRFQALAWLMTALASSALRSVRAISSGLGCDDHAQLAFLGGEFDRGGVPSRDDRARWRWPARGSATGGKPFLLSSTPASTTSNPLPTIIAVR